MLEKQGEKRRPSVFSRLFAGLSLFVLVFAAYSTLLALVYGPADLSLSLGCRWDCGWYRSIAENGYVSEIPPTPQDLARSNVAFFPLYPTLGRTVSGLTGLPVEAALPLVSILFAAGIFTLLPFLTSRLRFALALAFPAAFYFFVAYSESVYCFALFAGLLALMKREKIPYAATLGILFASGAMLGLTRLTGFVLPVGAFGVLLVGRRLGFFPDRGLLGLVAGWAVGSLLGAGGFFAYSHLKFGAWDLYFQTLNVGWKKESSFFGFVELFIRALPKNLLPPFFAMKPTRFSWMVNADAMILFAYALVVEGRAIFSAARAALSPDRVLRYALLAAGLAHLVLTSLGDSGNEHRWGNGMRYAMPVLMLLIIVWDREWTPALLKSRPRVARFLYVGTLAYWIPFQLYYLYLFTKNGWVS